MINPPKQVWLLTTEAIGMQGLDDTFDGRITCRVFSGLVGTLRPQRVNLVSLQPKDEYRDLPGLLPGKIIFVNEHPHQFGDGWMGIIELVGDLRRKSLK